MAMEKSIFDSLISKEETLLKSLLILSINGVYISIDQLLNYFSRVNSIIVSSNQDYINSIEYDYNERGNLSFGLLPSDLEELEFQYEFSATLNENSIPNTVKTIIFSESFNQALNKNIIPQSVTSIKFGDEFDQPFVNNKISTNCKDDDDDEGTFNKESLVPEAIKHLEFGNGFSQDIKIIDQLYSKNSLKSLILENDYGGVIEYGAIPNSVTTLSREFNSEMNSRDFNAKKDIGGSITSIQFDNYFNQNLTSLTMGSSYDKEFNENSLPKQLKVLILGNRFNRKLNKEMIPSTLESIKFGAKFNQTLPNDLFLHTNLKSLVLGSEYDKPFPLSAIPSKSITHLELSSIKGELPDLSNFHSLQSLYLGFFEKKIPIGHLPPNITSLTFGPKYKNISFEPNLLPNKLKKLIIKNQRFYQDQTTLSNSLPISLESIYISIENTEFINKLTSDFVSKFIRFY
ncbi:hypothetical protein DDB_G0276755 [Dictyostelium discoideum AX4]|uniref:FNIP repeat-containing protein n=1 Tax=Dictyostelium discoideum TaxID=44689 RepID=Q550Y2_DICDI|nr:hypothetical protein DDB_G0276755 [Dictyostelium discoideum AX4]EAL69081.2 hypothetical protein DDB_G0276755 [Dictyostelium discoideum AX4]|eukprot:XP_643002.2 hypothetical protein DDB_G0276755 [Dictyostelium discoideum AX4]